MNSPLTAAAKVQNGGAVLLLALVFLLMLAVIAAAVLQAGMLEFHMAGNDQFQEQAFQRAQAVASELSGDRNNFPLAGPVGYTLCAVRDNSPECDRSDLTAPLSGAVAEGVRLDYRVVRQGPLLVTGFPLRESQRVASGGGNFDAAIFEVRVDLDGSEKRLGSARVVQGIAVRLAASN